MRSFYYGILNMYLAQIFRISSLSMLTLYLFLAPSLSCDPQEAPERIIIQQSEFNGNRYTTYQSGRFVWTEIFDRGTKRQSGIESYSEKPARQSCESMGTQFDPNESSPFASQVDLPYTSSALSSVPPLEQLSLLGDDLDEDFLETSCHVDLFKESLQYDLDKLFFYTRDIAHSALIQPDNCHTDLADTIVDQLGYLGDFRTFLYKNKDIPPSFEGRIKALALLMGDIYEQKGFLDLPLRLMDLLRNESQLTKEKVQAAYGLLILPAQYMMVGMNKAQGRSRVGRYRAFHRMLERYLKASQDLVSYMALYDNIFFYQVLHTYTPDCLVQRALESSKLGNQFSKILPL